MKWTSEAPTKTGWYWIKSTNWVPHIVEVAFIPRLKKSFFWGVASDISEPCDKYPDAQWSGPIPEPEDA